MIKVLIPCYLYRHQSGGSFINKRPEVEEWLRDNAIVHYQIWHPTPTQLAVEFDGTAQQENALAFKLKFGG